MEQIPAWAFKRACPACLSDLSTAPCSLFLEQLFKLGTAWLQRAWVVAHSPPRGHDLSNPRGSIAAAVHWAVLSGLGASPNEVTIANVVPHGNDAIKNWAAQQQAQQGQQASDVGPSGSLSADGAEALRLIMECCLIVAGRCGCRPEKLVALGPQAGYVLCGQRPRCVLFLVHG